MIIQGITLTGVNVVDTVVSGSLVFNGSNSYLSMTPGFALGAGAYTIEGWVNSRGTSPQHWLAPVNQVL
jgi:hypothetical protein